MRLLIIPFILVAMLIQAPMPAFGNTNQGAAEKIANTIGENFPDASIDVSYKGGQVWLKGEAGSPEQRKMIIEQVFRVTGVSVSEVNDEIQIVAPKASEAPAKSSVQVAKPVVTAPVPMPQASPVAPRSAKQVPQTRQRMPQPQQPQQAQQQPQMMAPPQTASGAALAPYPYPQYQAAYGVRPGQQPVVPAPYVQQPPQAAQQPQPAPQYGHQYQPAYYGPPAQMAHHPEAYGPQGPLPGRYNQPNLPDYAWPAYANYPNYSQVSYPRMYSPKAWPYIGPFYPYPQAPLGWRKVTLENHNGWWWLDFDDGAPSGPFSGLFRQPAQYTY